MILFVDIWLQMLNFYRRLFSPVAWKQLAVASASSDSTLPCRWLSIATLATARTAELARRLHSPSTLVDSRHRSSQATKPS